jgi:DNA-binding transcriptional regulator YhcF (GntR family)
MPKQSSPSPHDTGEVVAQELARISESVETLLASNHRIEGLLRILAQPVLQSALHRVFKDGKQLHAYELSDGNRSTREIGKLVGVDQKTVSRWWRAWEKEYGIIEKTGKRGQFRGRYSLADLVALQSNIIAGAALETVADQGRLL